MGYLFLCFYIRIRLLRDFWLARQNIFCNLSCFYRVCLRGESVRICSFFQNILGYLFCFFRIFILFLPNCISKHLTMFYDSGEISRFFGVCCFTHCQKKQLSCIKIKFSCWNGIVSLLATINSPVFCACRSQNTVL